MKKQTSPSLRWTLLLLSVLTCFGCQSSDSSGGGSSAPPLPPPTPCIADIKATSVSQDDPLGIHQWHLNNTGQTAFAENGGTPGADLNMMRSIQGGCTGEGVLVAVVDSGLEIAHEDISANIVPNGSYDLAFQDNDPTPSNANTGGDHGTSVAGLIAAAMNNGKGGRGIAPKASLKGFNLLSPYTPGSNANVFYSLGAATATDSIPLFVSNDVHVFNLSFGANPLHDTPIDLDLENQLIFGTQHLRDGRGALYIKAGGNEFSYVYGDTEAQQNACRLTNNAGLGCYNTNMEPIQTSPFLIVTGALNANGTKASYSSTGSSLWITAPGGEFGTTDPAMITIDRSSCNRGYTTASSNTIGTALDPQCNYTQSFNGTSSSTPVISGVVALMLQSYPALTWRDVKHILAKTARKVDPGKTAVTLTLPDGSYQALPAWVTNQAGFHYHNWYGFGAVDVDAALATVKVYPPNSLGTLLVSSWKTASANLPIPDESSVGASTSILITEAAGITLEAVQVQVNVTHPYTGDLGIELTSPHGTRSILLNAGSHLQNDIDLDDMQLLSNAFYGETSVNGAWTLRVVDVSSPDSGTLNSWKIRFYGH